MELQENVWLFGYERMSNNTWVKNIWFVESINNSNTIFTGKSFVCFDSKNSMQEQIQAGYHFRLTYMVNRIEKYLKNGVEFGTLSKLKEFNNKKGLKSNLKQNGIFFEISKEEAFKYIYDYGVMVA